MSWSFGAIVQRGEGDVDVEAQVTEAADAHFAALAEQGTERTPETDDQVDAAVRAIGVLVSAVGTNGELQVNLSGHSNPGHGKQEGYGNELISVSLAER
jgi:hypothetical protein